MANKLSLNVTKTELIIFHSNAKKIGHSRKFKLDGKGLTPTSTVKYLGVFLDDHLLWSKQKPCNNKTKPSHWYTL